MIFLGVWLLLWLASDRADRASICPRCDRNIFLKSDKKTIPSHTHKGTFSLCRRSNTVWTIKD